MILAKALLDGFRNVHEDGFFAGRTTAETELKEARMELAPFVCNNCGARVQMPASGDFVICQDCQSQLKVSSSVTEAAPETTPEANGDSATDSSEKNSRTGVMIGLLVVVLLVVAAPWLRDRACRRSRRRSARCVLDPSC